MQETALYYSAQLEKSVTELNDLKKKIRWASLGRLIFFLLISFCVYHLFHAFQMLWLILLLINLSGFLGMISWFVNIKNKQAYQIQLIWFYQNELAQVQGKPNLYNDGAAFDDGTEYWSDLDIFGKGSLFHYINRTVTQHGEKALANQFKNTLLDKQAILFQQEAIQAYSKQLQIVASIIAQSLVNKTNTISFDSIYEWLKTKNGLHESSWAKFIRFALPTLNILIIAFIFLSEKTALFGIVIVLGWSQLAFYATYFQSNFNILGKKENILKQHASILEKFIGVDPNNSALLLEYQKTAQEAFIAIRDLSKISNRIDQRLNLFFITFVNPILLYDIQNMFALEAWKIKHRDHLANWIALVGEIEKLNSFAIYAFNNKAYVYPRLLSEPKQLKAIELAHPLISKEKTVANSIEINGMHQVLLITGSNMSGKTTFLRTIGVNLILSQMGLPVPATSFAFNPMKIFSSIRISDSLQENNSYFMAELKKLRKIKDGVQASESSIIFIDEILRGTNSEDKYFGSAEFVKEMIELNCITLFATHDLQLSELEKEFPNAVTNYCFESRIENDELIFPYIIERGVAKNRNASFLMKKMGII